ncbi:hypothetical protein AMTR_s00126p00075420, partial [Amborella trichopoda]
GCSRSVPSVSTHALTSPPNKKKKRDPDVLVESPAKNSEPNCRTPQGHILFPTSFLFHQALPLDQKLNTSALSALPQYSSWQDGLNLQCELHPHSWRCSNYLNPCLILVEMIGLQETLDL